MPANKTQQLRALMHSLIAHSKQRPKPITLLYVKSIPNTGSIRSIFTFARFVAPCLLIIEDIDTQVTRDKLSYFFNEVDGLENNDGILMIATTNHLDKLDEGLKRPSRFDRRYLFPLPALSERRQYSEFWRRKLKRNGAKMEFPEGLSARIAGITAGFSFATMKEAFVATLLSLARNGDDDGGDDDNEGIVKLDKGHGDYDDLPLWKEIQVQIKLLRKEMEKTHRLQTASPDNHGRYSSDANEASGYRDPGQQGYDAHMEAPRMRPRMITNPATGFRDQLDDGTACERGSTLPLRPPPSGTPTTNAASSRPYLNGMPLAGQNLLGFAPGHPVYQQEFPAVEGQADVRDVEASGV